MEDFVMEPSWYHRSLQGNAAAGGVFLGGNQTDTGEGGLGDGLGLTIVLVFLAMIGIVALAAGSTYLVSYVSDYYCCCLPWFRPVNTHVRFDHGRVAKQARLFGLTLAERQKLLSHIFGGKDNKLVYMKKKTVSPVDASPTLPLAAPTAAGVVPEGDLDKKETVIAETMTTTLPAVEMDVEAAVDGDPTTPDDNDAAEEEDSPPMDDADHERLCCICLAEYLKGDHLLRGQTCGHQFHYTCSMDWLSVPHDHCPYCRQALFDPANYRAAAVRLLGDKRVAEMDLFVPRTTTMVAPETEFTANDNGEGDVELPSMQAPALEAPATFEAPGTEAPDAEAPAPSTQETPDEGAIIANEDDSPATEIPEEETGQPVAETPIEAADIPAAANEGQNNESAN